jgi:hypothetical protein
MLYLLLEEEDGYISSIDHGYSYWKRVGEFQAGSYQEALSHVPVDKYGKFKLYEVRATWELETKKQEAYTLVDVSHPKSTGGKQAG